jgi:hypothetical protein
MCSARSGEAEKESIVNEKSGKATFAMSITV